MPAHNGARRPDFRPLAGRSSLAVMFYDRAFRLQSWRSLLRPGNGRRWFYVALWLAAFTTFALAEAGARGDTSGFGANIPWYEYFYTQCWAIAHYLQLMVWPHRLSVDYGYRALHDWRGFPGLALLSMFGLATIVAWTRVERAGWFAFSGTMFFMLLAPSSSFVPAGS
jgi:hypothetical protein